MNGPGYPLSNSPIVSARRSIHEHTEYLDAPQRKENQQNMGNHIVTKISVDDGVWWCLAYRVSRVLFRSPLFRELVCSGMPAACSCTLHSIGREHRSLSQNPRHTRCLMTTSAAFASHNILRLPYARYILTDMSNIHMSETQQLTVTEQFSKIGPGKNKHIPRLFRASQSTSTFPLGRR